MTVKLTIVDQSNLALILNRCQQLGLAVVQARSYSSGQQRLSWRIYTDNPSLESLLLIEFGSSLARD